VNDYRKDGKRRTLYLVALLENNNTINNTYNNKNNNNVYIDNNSNFSNNGNNNYNSNVESNSKKNCPIKSVLNQPPNFSLQSPIPTTSKTSPTKNINYTKKYRLKSYSEFAKNFPLSSIPKLHKNKKFSSIEKRRRQIIETYKTITKQHFSTLLLQKLTKFLVSTTTTTTTNDADIHFLEIYDGKVIKKINKIPTSTSSSTSITGEQNVSFEGCGAVAQSRRHWSEIFLFLNSVELVVYLNYDCKKVLYRLPLNLILSIRKLKKEERPFEEFSFFQIETFSRFFFFILFFLLF
jgi:hypothetical protein